MKMKQWKIYALMTLLAGTVSLSGCQNTRKVPDLTKLLELENEEATKKLSAFTREEIVEAWGAPDYEMQFGNGDLYIQDDNDECLCVYYEADQSTVKYASVNLHGGIQEFTGVVTEDYKNSAVVEIDEGNAICSSGYKVTVDLGDEDEILDVEVGDHVYVTYIGPVMESSPLQLQDQISISVIDAGGAVEKPDTDEGYERDSFDMDNMKEPEPVADVQEECRLDGVTLFIQDITPTSATVKVLNETDLEIMYGEDYGLQMYENGAWYDVPYLIDNWAVVSIGYGAPKNVPVQWEVNWETFHGVLKAGKYRLVKGIMDFRKAGDYTEYLYFLEFEIAE